MNLAYHLLTRGLPVEERTKVDDVLLSRAGEPDGPPSWWKGEAEAAMASMAALAQMKRTAGRR